jgi:hypothetical protein
MGRDLLTETIEAVADYDYTTEEEDDSSMSYPPSYSAGSCPEPAGDITINQSIVDLGVGSGAISEQQFTGVTGTSLTLSHTPIATFDIELFRNGVKQAETADFTVSGTTVTLGSALTVDDLVIVRYAYEVS